MQEVVPAVPRHDVEQQQPAAHDPRLGAGRRARQGDNHVGRGHQGRNLVGEPEREHPSPLPGELAQFTLDPRVPAGDREDVDARVGQPGGRR